MSYTKHEFKSGDTLYASQLNEMDEYISKTVIYTKQSLTEEQKAQARDNIGITNIGGTESVPWYKNKKILFLGDSVTITSSRGWVKFFNDIMSPSVAVNIAVSGARYCDYSDTVYDGNPTEGGNSSNVIGNQVEKIKRGKDSTHPNYSAVPDYEDFDIILIAAGTNDGAPSGDFESSFTADNAPVALSALNRTVFASAVRYSVETLQTLYPNALVFVCTPIQAYVNTRYFADTKAKRDCLIALCERMSVPYIDTFMCGISAMFEVKSSEGRDLRDGLHPNINGAQKIAKYNAKEVINYVSSYSVSPTADDTDDTYTNQVPISVDENGNVYNSTGYKTGWRVSSSGTEKESAYAVCTGFIPFTIGDTMRMQPAFAGYGTENTINFFSYANGVYTNLGQVNDQPFGYGICSGKADLYRPLSENNISTLVLGAEHDSRITHIRITHTTPLTNQGTEWIVTINEEIK